MMVLLPTFIRDETRENKDRLYMQFFECTEVGFNALCESERETACRGKKRLSRGRIVGQELEVV
jgi:hypothetical protein